MTRLLALVCLATAPLAFATPKDDVSKPLKTVVNSVRYGKDVLALKNFAGEAQGKELCLDAWDKASADQKKTFIEQFQLLFARIAFPKIRKNFENLDTVLYDEPTVEGDTAAIASTILINHPLKKQELKVKYRLLKSGKDWKVIDVSVLGDSMLQGIRDDQVQPLIKESGFDGLLKAMKAKNDELKDVVVK
ncbi:MAG: ABC transporter substrate-binding protein [Myxococcaceae bacterium]|nr:ABC transporter substrate-binding protein [Myxococcaceae bacterium]